MYQNIYISRKDMVVHLWDDGVPDSNGKSNSTYASFPYPKYAYKRQVGGKFKSIYGEALTKVFSFSDGDPNLYESDVSLETRILLDRYEESDEPSKGHKIGIIDIEVSTEGGFPNMDEADKEITAISMYDYITKTCHNFVLDKDGLIKNEERDGGLWCPQNKDWVPSEDDRVKLIIRSYDDEDNLLMAFMNKWQECGFTIITGWNNEYFDMPYLYNRLKACLGAKVAKFLSPIGVAYMNPHSKKLTIAGISVLDYILLYKKMTQKMEPTYALGPIGKKIVGIDKIQYRGNLNDLYKSDIEKFIEYNTTDVKIVLALDKKLQFIDLARTMCHVGHVPYEWFHMSSRYLDGAILMYLKRNGGLIAPNKPAKGEEEYEERIEEGDEGFSGAYVKEPIPGKYNWIFDLDLTSMYPNIIISLNISPETKIGKIDRVTLEENARVEKRMRTVKEYDDWETKDKFENDIDFEKYVEHQCDSFDMMNHVGRKIETYKLAQIPYTKHDFTKLLNDSKYALSSNGVLFRQDRPGVIPTILSLWFQQRQDMRKKASTCKKKGDIEGYKLYDQRQKVWKILLNSMYGVLGLPIFRFYDVDNAEAVTTCGVDIIQTTAKAINAYYKSALESEKDGDWVIYTDTDSCFVDAVPLIKKRYPQMDFKDETKMTTTIMEIATEVQIYVNQFYSVMSKRFFNLDEHAFDAKQELISKTSLFLAKKRYAQWIIHKEGVLLKEPELEVKGIDVVRTSFPAAFRKFLENFLKQILLEIPKVELDDLILKFKEEVKTLDVLQIAKNTSVKFISGDGKYNYNPESRRPFQVISGTPAQVKACLHYNDLLDKWDLSKIVEPIHHGQKIKWVYLKDNSYGINCIAMKGDGNDPNKMLEFINLYVDRTAMFEQELKSKLANTKKQGMYDVLRWEFPNPSMKTAANFFEF